MHQDVASTPHRRRGGYGLIAASLTLIGLATLVPQRYAAAHSLCIICGDTGVVDFLLNIVLFMPLGIGLARRGVGRRRAIIGMIVLTGIIESLQFSIIPGRDASLGDLFANSLGGAIGFLLVATAPKWTRPSHRGATGLTMVASVVWLGIHWVTSYAVQPSMTSSTYYGQITRSESSPFPGVFLSASIGGVPIPNHILSNSAVIKRLLEQRSTLTEVRVVPGGRTRSPSALLRIADHEGNEILTTQQSREDFIFALRTHASDLRLRPLLFRVSRVFAGRGPADTLLITAQYAEHGAIINIKSPRDSSARDLRLSSSLSWMMVFPFVIYMNGSPVKTAFTCLWIAALVFPVAYWGRWWSARSSRGPLAWAVGVASVLLTGMALIPAAFRIAPASLLEWLAAIVGVALAARSARRRIVAEQILPA